MPCLVLEGKGGRLTRGNTTVTDPGERAGLQVYGIKTMMNNLNDHVNAGKVRVTASKSTGQSNRLLSSYHYLPII